MTVDLFPTAADARQILIDELGDIYLVDTLLMKLWLAGFKVAPVEDSDGLLRGEG